MLYISATTVLKVVAVLVGLYVAWLIRDILALVFLALFLAAIIQPVADAGARYKIPRGVTVLLLYFFVFGIVGLLIVLLIPTLVEESIKIGALIGSKWDAINGAVGWAREMASKYALHNNVASSLASVQEQAANAVAGAFKTVADIFGGIAAFVIVLVMAFYLVTQDDKAKTIVKDWIAPKHHAFALHMLDVLQEKISQWFGGQVLLCLIIGSMYYIGLLAIGIESALALSLFGGFTEFIPYLGPILGGIPIVFVAFAESPLKGVLALGVIVLIQQAENHLVVPKVMQKAVGLNPLVSIVSMLIGAKLFGVLGALLAIPLATALMVALKELRAYQNSLDA